jgi:pimeloyl-ACP methyl ester carboxylesterase
VPVIFLNHLTGVSENFDPRIVDGVAARHRVITFDNRGVGASDGKTPTSIAGMARDTVAFIRALGFDQVDLLAFSLGGFIAQEIAQAEPQLVRKLILAGTGPAGGQGIDKVTATTIQDIVKGALTLKDSKRYLFFTQT